MKSKINKEDFIKALTTMSREQITDLIRAKGKEPKLIKPFVILAKNN